MNYRVQTEWPIAKHSVDHTHPRGTKNDNSTNEEFVKRLSDVIAMPMVLDLGCSGGGFVESVLQADGFAIGIDGSDYSLRSGRAAWGRLANKNLFTADIGKPFLILRKGNNWLRPGSIVHFDFVTMWEVLEHLTIPELETLVLNIHTHLAPGGHFIFSVSTASDTWEGKEYHQTIQPDSWWKAFFMNRGFVMNEFLFKHLSPHWVRGPNTEGPSSTCFVFQK